MPIEKSKKVNLNSKAVKCQRTNNVEVTIVEEVVIREEVLTKEVGVATRASRV